MKGKIPREGGRQVSEPTDPDYTDKALERLRRDYQACPDEWKTCFLNGLSKFDQNYVLRKRTF